uniref:Uncharacterized protein n=1 Tax=Zea mays TaxID=4577 RepID=B4FT70_MAIZE|nr:unknown [Zea mays]
MEHHHKPGLRVRLRITAARRRAWLSACLRPPCRKPPRRDHSDSVHKVARREIGGGHRRPPRPAAPSSSSFSCPEKFRNFQLQTVVCQESGRLLDVSLTATCRLSSWPRGHLERTR